MCHRQRCKRATRYELVTGKFYPLDGVSATRNIAPQVICTRCDFTVSTPRLKEWVELMGTAEAWRGPKLNARDRAILELLFDGLTNLEIGQTLHLSPLTVRNCISQLLAKFDARNRTDLVVKVVIMRLRYRKRILSAGKVLR